MRTTYATFTTKRRMRKRGSWQEKDKNISCDDGEVYYTLIKKQKTFSVFLSRVSHSFFRVLSNLQECFYNLIETRTKYFLFLLENSPTKITENEEYLFIILYTTQFTRHNLINQLRNRNIFPVSIEFQKRRLLTNQRAYFLRAIF